MGSDRTRNGNPNGNPKEENPLLSGRAWKPPAGTTFGFSILEERSRLKSRWQGASPQTLKEAKDAGESINELYNKIIWVYSGDAMPIPVEECQGAELLLHDCNFLDVRDRTPGSRSHTSLQELEILVAEAAPKKTWGIHVSCRYEPESLEFWSKKARGKGISLAKPGQRLYLENSGDQRIPKGRRGVSPSSPH